MQTYVPAHAGRLAMIDPPSAFPAAGGTAQLKLARLMELRAVIDSLRYERETRDPLISWVIGQENTRN